MSYSLGQAVPNGIYRDFNETLGECCKWDC